MIQFGEFQNLKVLTLGLVIGVACGSLVSILWIRQGFKSFATLSRDFDIADEGDYALGVYFTAKDSCAIVALEHFISVIESYREHGLVEKPALMDLALAYGRLALSAEAAGDRTLADQAFARGVAVAREFDQKITEGEDLEKLVLQFDASWRETLGDAPPIPIDSQ